ncbi:hypothetical protein [Xanthobacter aminoxidans]|uniref:hypothetical protein n=1 Tax=Xanthobacter aminoxidans TaxID=186280 RepID=UPI00372BEB3B
MTRIRFDWDADGAFAALTRPGAAAEELRLSPQEVDTLLRDLLAAALAQRGRVVVRPARWLSPTSTVHQFESSPEPNIGRFGE